MLHTFIMLVHYLCAGSIIFLVLIQRGKGAEAGAGFGAGASGTVFGARGAGTALSRATAVLAALFMLTSLTLAYVGTRRVPSRHRSLIRSRPPPAARRRQRRPPRRPPVAPAMASRRNLRRPSSFPRFWFEFADVVELVDTLA